MLPPWFIFCFLCGSLEFLSSRRTRNLNLNLVSLLEFYVVAAFNKRGNVCVWILKEDVKQSLGRYRRE